MKLTDAHTITAVVVEYTMGNGRKTLGQIAVGDLPPFLRDAIGQANEYRLDELPADEEK
jgi:hypothetical protein